MGIQHLKGSLVGMAIVFAQAASPVLASTSAVMTEDASLPNHTIYHPADLSTRAARSLPVVVWGNGACGNAGNAFEGYLKHIAEAGFVVIANGPIAEVQGSRPPRPGAPTPSETPSPARHPAMPSTPEQMIEAIDWSVAPTRGGDLAKAIDPRRIAVAGQSCGGLQALVTAADPRVKTAVIMNSGVIWDFVAQPGKPKPDVAVGLPMPDLGKLHTPTIYIIGGPTDIAYANANKDFDAIAGVPLMLANTDTGHNGTYWDADGGRFAETAAQWLLWQLKSDRAAARNFVGAKCRLCTSPEWTIRKKNLR